MDGATGRVVEADDPYHDSPGRKLRVRSTRCTAARSAGPFGIGLIFLLGLSTSEMCITGFYTWWKKRESRQAATAQKPRHDQPPGALGWGRRRPLWPQRRARQLATSARPLPPSHRAFQRHRQLGRTGSRLYAGSSRRTGRRSGAIRACSTHRSSPICRRRTATAMRCSSRRGRCKAELVEEMKRALPERCRLLCPSQTDRGPILRASRPAQQHPLYLRRPRSGGPNKCPARCRGPRARQALSRGPERDAQPRSPAVRLGRGHHRRREVHDHPGQGPCDGRDCDRGPSDAFGDFAFSADWRYLFWIWRDPNSRPRRLYRRLCARRSRHPGLRGAGPGIPDGRSRRARPATGCSCARSTT